MCWPDPVSTSSLQTVSLNSAYNFTSIISYRSFAYVVVLVPRLAQLEFLLVFFYVVGLSFLFSSIPKLVYIRFFLPFPGCFILSFIFRIIFLVSVNTSLFTTCPLFIIIPFIWPLCIFLPLLFITVCLYFRGRVFFVFSWVVTLIHVYSLFLPVSF